MPKTTNERASRAERWHQSGVEQMIGCPRSWFLEHMLGVDVPGKANTVAGTAYHAGVEWLERGRMLGEPRDRAGMRAAAHATLQEELASVPPEKAAAVVARAGKDVQVTGVAALEHQLDAALEAFWEAPLPESGLTIHQVLQAMEPLALEAYLSADLFPAFRTLAGTVDGIYWDPAAGQVVVVDHKTSAKVTEWKPGKGTEQAAHYSALVRDCADLALLDPRLPTGYLPPVLFLVASRVVPLRKAQRVALVRVDVGAHDVAGLELRVGMAEGHRSQGRFPADPSYRFCGTCSFAARCVHGTRELMAPARDLLAAAA